MATRALRRGCRPGVETLEARLALSAFGQDPMPAPGLLTSTYHDHDPAGDVEGVTDPSVIKQGNAYYLFSSGVGIPIRRSTDLVHWSKAGRVFSGIPAWARAKVPGAQAIWAPDVSFFGGQYHLYYTVSEFGTNRSVIGLATSPTLDPSSPAYRWADQGEVIASKPGRTPWNALDPQVVLDAQGQPWLSFGSQWSGIKLARLDPLTGKLAVGGGVRGPALALRGVASRPGSKPIEAPFIVSRGGLYYLFVSFDRCCMGAASTYKVMVGRSPAVDGPYLDRFGQPMTRGGGTLVVAGDGRFRGPGHNAVLTEGGRTWIFNHAYDALRGGVARLQVRPLGWTQDGWPVAGPRLF